MVADFFFFFPACGGGFDKILFTAQEVSLLLSSLLKLGHGQHNNGPKVADFFFGFLACGGGFGEILFATQGVSMPSISPLNLGHGQYDQKTNFHCC